MPAYDDLVWKVLWWLRTHQHGAGVKHTTEAVPTELLEPLGPHPDPWMTAMPALVAAAAVLQMAAPELAPELGSDLKQRLLGSATKSIQDVLDDYCGTYSGPPIPPRRMYWPWPSPPPWLFAMAEELQRIANTAEAAGMQAYLLNVAGQVVQRGLKPGPS